MHISVNRAPVLTLWAAVVAERLGFEWNEALALGRVVAGLNAYSKGQSLHRAVPVRQTAGGLRELSKDQPVSPESVQRYLEGKFGDAFPAVEQAMLDLANSMSPDEIARRAYALYEAFRPEVPGGTPGWGAAGVLDLRRIRNAAGGSH